MMHTLNPNAIPTRPIVRRRFLFSLVISLSLLVSNLAMLSVAAAPHGSELTRFTYTEYHMGVDARLVVYAPNQKTAEDACLAAFARIATLDWVMSDYRPKSELMQLCAKAGGAPVRVSPDLFKALQRAQQVSRESRGTFDITVGPVVALWREARKTGILPEPAAIENARKRVGWQKIKLNPAKRTVQLMVPGMKLDLGGIGKGFAADEAQTVLKKHGIRSALVELGGDIVVTAAPPNTDGWTIRAPNAGADGTPTDLHLVHCAVSTSGDTEQFVVIGGKRYSHLVDPRTGQALTRGVQVTVIAPTGLISDPLSKAFSILDAQDRTKLLRSYPKTRAYVKVRE